MCSVWHDTAIRFHEVIQQFEYWLVKHHLWEKEVCGFVNKAALVHSKCPVYTLHETTILNLSS